MADHKEFWGGAEESHHVGWACFTIYFDNILEVKWFLCDDAMIILVHHQVQSRLHFDVGNLNIGIIF